MVESNCVDLGHDYFKMPFRGQCSGKYYSLTDLDNAFALIQVIFRIGKNNSSHNVEEI